MTTQCVDAVATQWESLLTSHPPSEIEMHQSRGLERPRRPAGGRSRAARWAYNPLAMLSVPARYFDLVREMKNAYNHRLLELVIGLAVFPLVFVSHGGALL